MPPWPKARASGAKLLCVRDVVWYVTRLGCVDSKYSNRLVIRVRPGDHHGVAIVDHYLLGIHQDTLAVFPCLRRQRTLLRGTLALRALRLARGGRQLCQEGETDCDQRQHHVSRFHFIPFQCRVRFEMRFPGLTLTQAKPAAKIAGSPAVECPPCQARHILNKAFSRAWF